MIRPQYVELKEFPGWWLSSSGVVTKEPAGFCSRCTEPGIEELTEFAGASAFKYWHDGHGGFKAYNIVRVSNMGRKVVYQQTGGKPPNSAHSWQPIKKCCGVLRKRQRCIKWV
jgi:hypothetical protein